MILNAVYRCTAKEAQAHHGETVCTVIQSHVTNPSPINVQHIIKLLCPEHLKLEPQFTHIAISLASKITNHELQIQMPHLYCAAYTYCGQWHELVRIIV